MGTAGRGARKPRSGCRRDVGSEVFVLFCFVLFPFLCFGQRGDGRTYMAWWEEVLAKTGDVAWAKGSETWAGSRAGWDVDEHPLLVFLKGWEGYQSDDLITPPDGVSVPIIAACLNHRRCFRCSHPSAASTILQHVERRRLIAQRGLLILRIRRINEQPWASSDTETGTSRQQKTASALPARPFAAHAASLKPWGHKASQRLAGIGQSRKRPRPSLLGLGERMWGRHFLPLAISLGRVFPTVFFTGSASSRLWHPPVT